jgi:hypothetical protein
MDILITIALIYFAYRGYSWYSSMQEQIKGSAPREVEDEEIVINPQPGPGSEDDFIDYEEIK